MRQATAIVIAATAILAAPGASAQAAWRCGNSYSQQPCAGGTPVTAGDARTAAERKQGADVARNDWALADRMEKERLAQEKSAGKALVIGPPAAPTPKPAASAAKHKKGAKPDEFSAVDPATVKHKKKKAAAQ